MPFFKGFLGEVKAGAIGMMTLVALAITVAYVYSVAVVFGLHGKLNLHKRSLRTTKNLGEMFMWLSTVTMTVRSIPQWNMAMCSMN
jgi:cation transport ATPase